MEQTTIKQSSKNRFNFNVPLEMDGASIKMVTKEVDGVERTFITGIASNTMVDKEGDRVSAEFIEKMQKTAMGLTIFEAHNYGVDDTLGTIVSSGGNEDNFVIEAALEPEQDNERVKTILRKMKNKIKMGFSIGGIITKVEKENVDGRTVTKLADGELIEVSITPLPAAYGTWISQLTKSLDNFVADQEPVEQEADVTEVVVKVLQEMINTDEMYDKLYQMMWAFRSAVYDITFNPDLMPDEKRAKIETVASEYATAVESISAEIAANIQAIDSELS